MYLNKEALVIRYQQTGDADLKEQIVASYAPLVHYIAKKFTYYRDDLDDLVQVGNMGLLRSLDRFDPSLETDFSTFATPNIIGEIKHYFRDKRGIVKVPRKLQEMNSKVRRYVKEKQVMGHSPTVSEIAEALDFSEENVLECMEASISSQVISLDMPSYQDNSSKDSGKSSSLLDTLSNNEDDTAMINKVSLQGALEALDEREQKIIKLRFYSGLSQSEIAARMNLSQMHISRLLSGALKNLRKVLEK